MEQRLDPIAVAPQGYQAMRQLQAYANESGLPVKLQELVKIRASQINGCAYCLQLHVREARKAGETDDRIHMLNAWREVAGFDARERAALAWTEVLTRLADGPVPDDVYAAARAQFSERELVDLTYAIMAINAWNRLMASFRVPPRA